MGWLCGRWSHKACTDIDANNGDVTHICLYCESKEPIRHIPYIASF